MVDDLITPAEGDPTAPKPKTGLAGFVATRNGRIILGGVGLVVVALAAAAAVWVFVLAPSDGEVLAPSVPPAGSVVVTGSVSATEAAPVNRRTRPLSSTFVFRDIFVPTVKPAVEPTAGAGAVGTSSGTTTADEPGIVVPADTLMLRSITTADGVPMATFIWNDQTYTVGAGSQLGDTPWRVISIEGRTAVLLFGDSRVSLTVGQGVTK